MGADRVSAARGGSDLGQSALVATAGKLTVEGKSLDHLIHHFFRATDPEPDQIQILRIGADKHLTIGLIVPGGKHGVNVGNNGHFPLKRFAMHNL